MKRQSDIKVIEGRQYVETEHHLYGLGLQLPEVKTQAFPTLATRYPVLGMKQIREIVERDEFSFGRSLFDSSWITNQNGYGSCAAYGGASALSKSRVIGGQVRIELSGDYLYSLVNDGRDQGAMLDDVMHALNNRGVATKELVPLGGIYRNKYDTDKADQQALRFRSHESFACPDEQTLATALAVVRSPVVHAIHVTSKWRSFDADDVLDKANNGPGNHCEHLDDIKYDRKRGCFLYRKATSHGANYSDDGYCWLTWKDHLETPSRYHQFYVIPSATQDPYGDNPGQEEPEELKPLTKPVVTIQKSESCVWCTKWMETEAPKVIDAGYRLVEGRVSGRGFPRFNLRVNGKKYNFSGFWNFNDIASKVAEMQSQRQEVV